MFNLSNLEDFKLNKLRIAIPKSESKPLYNSIIFLLGRNRENNVSLMTNKLINYQNLYKYIYKDFIYKGKIYNKSFYLKYNKERDSDYDFYKEQIQGLHTVPLFKSLSQKNVFIDNTVLLNQYFQYTKSSFKLVCSEFVELIKGIFFDSKYEEYTSKYALLDIQGWDLNKSDLNKQNLLSNPISILYIGLKKYPEMIKSIGNITFIILNGEQALFKFNPSKIDDKSYNDFKREVNKFKANLISDSMEDIIEKGLENLDTQQKQKVEKIKSSINNKINLSDNESIKEIIDDKINNEEKENKSENDIIDNIENEALDMKTLDELRDVINSNVMAKSKASSARDAELREKIKDIKWDADKKLTIKDIMEQSLYEDIKVNDVSDKIKTLNDNVKKVTFSNFEKTYNEKNLYPDIINTVLSLDSKKELPVFLLNVTREDTSDSLNQKETFTFHLEDSNRVRHTLKIDIPKFVDNKFMYLSGNKKIFIKQLILKPIVKIAPDVVQICTNYNKIFMYRYGELVSPKIERFKKFVLSHPEWFEVIRGNGFAENNNYKTTIEYDSIAKEFIKIKIKNSTSEFIFSQKLIDERLEENKSIDGREVFNKDTLIYGFWKPGESEYPYVLDCEKSQSSVVNGDDEELKSFDEADIVDRILYELMKIKKVKNVSELGFNEIKIGKRFMYTRCTVMQKKIPTIIFLSYFEGLSTVLRKAEINHYFTDKRPINLDTSKGYIQFANGYLIYDRYPIRNSLLLNALEIIPTKDYNYEDFDNKDVYLDIFDILFNSRILASGLDSYYDNMIDPITLGILKEMNYPTDFVSLVLYASALLADNNYTSEIDMNVFRVRSNEMIAAHLYKIIANAYSRYKRTANNRNPVKISVNQDALIKEILTSQVVEDYSILNPIVECEKSSAITSKGPSGINLSEAYTQEKRSYHKSMIGLMGISTSPKSI